MSVPEVVSRTMSWPGHGSQNSWHALQGHQAGREHLAGQLGDRVEPPDVVDDADEADDQRTGEHPADLVARGEDAVQQRQLGGHRQGREHADEHPHPAQARDRDVVHVAVADLGQDADPDRTRPHQADGEVGDGRRDQQGEEVLAHLPALSRAGTPGARADQTRPPPGPRSAAAEPSASRTARPMSPAISFMSVSVMPWVVTAGVPTRMPEPIVGGCGSYGIAFLFRVMRAASQRVSASAPVTPTPCRSISARWVSVPPETGRMPSAASPSASACAFAMTCRAYAW